jgi:lantibiotic biosynthesis protein
MLAQRVGDALCASALWDDSAERCNWIAKRDIEDREIAPYSIRTAALSPELYSGSAGLALFLAELYAAYGVTANGCTAHGAWRRSLHYLRTRTTPAPPFSFYAGHLGVAYAGLRLSYALPQHAQALHQDLNWLLDEVVLVRDIRHGLDQIGGNAGAIAPLLILGDALGRQDCLDTAVRLGDQIADKAQWRDGVCFWDFEKVHGIEMDSPPMTGFSHGASGMALGLLELYARTGDLRHLKTARGALAFESALFDEAAGNWIDTRYPYSKCDGKVTGVCRSAWCHGAPGVALVQLRAAELDADRAPDYLHFGGIAVASTLRFLDEGRQQTLTDATLCHGASGLSEIVFTCGHLLGDDALIRSAQAFVDTFSQQHPEPDAWPSGLTNHLPTLGLMIGNAGVGLHALRVATCGAVPSVLLLQPHGH